MLVSNMSSICIARYITQLLLVDVQFEQENDAVYLDLQGDYSETMETGAAGSFQGELFGGQLIQY